MASTFKVWWDWSPTPNNQLNIDHNITWDNELDFTKLFYKLEDNRFTCPLSCPSSRPPTTFRWRQRPLYKRHRTSRQTFHRAEAGPGQKRSTCSTCSGRFRSHPRSSPASGCASSQASESCRNSPPGRCTSSRTEGGFSCKQSPGFWSRAETRIHPEHLKAVLVAGPSERRLTATATTTTQMLRRRRWQWTCCPRRESCCRRWSSSLVWPCMTSSTAWSTPSSSTWSSWPPS